MGVIISLPDRQRPDRQLPDRKQSHPGLLWREALGVALRKVRDERGERLVDVAERAGISTQYLSEIERGRKEPSSEMIAAVSGALGRDLAAILTEVATSLSPSRAAGPELMAA